MGAYNPTNEDFVTPFNNTLATMSKAALDATTRQQIALEAENMFKGAAAEPMTASFDAPPAAAPEPGIPRTRDTVATDQAIADAQTQELQTAPASSQVPAPPSQFGPLQASLRSSYATNPRSTEANLAAQGVDPELLYQLMRAPEMSPELAAALSGKQITAPAFTQGTATPDALREKELQTQLPQYGKSATAPASGPYQPAPEPVGGYGVNAAGLGTVGANALLVADTRRKVAEESARRSAAGMGDKDLAILAGILKSQAERLQAQKSEMTMNGASNLMTLSPEKRAVLEDLNAGIEDALLRQRAIADKLAERVMPGVLPPAGTPATPRTKVKDKVKGDLPMKGAPMSWLARLRPEKIKKYRDAFGAPENAQQNRMDLSEFLYKQAQTAGDIK
jgi:hypothetical protein